MGAFAGHVTVGQWWLVAIAVSLLLPAALYFCLRSKKGALYSLVVPAIGAFSVGGHSRVRGHVAEEALVMYSVALLSIALLLVAMRPDVREYAERAEVGEEYEIPKWKVSLYAVLVLGFAILAVSLLLPL